MNYKRTITIILAASILTAIAAFAFMRVAPQKVEAFNPQPDPPGYGLVGLVTNQSLRINVANLGNPPDPDSPPDPCRVVIIFRDGNGTPLTTPNGVVIRRVALLQGGQSTSLTLNADNFVREGSRFQLRPDVRIQQADGTNGLPPDPCIPSAEVMGNENGRTQFMLNFIPAVQRARIPQ